MKIKRLASFYLKQSFSVDICEILQKSLLLPNIENSSVEHAFLSSRIIIANVTRFQFYALWFLKQNKWTLNEMTIIPLLINNYWVYCEYNNQISGNYSMESFNCIDAQFIWPHIRLLFSVYKSNSGNRLTLIWYGHM